MLSNEVPNKWLFVKHLKSKRLKVRRDKNEGETLGETFKTVFID